MKVSHEPDKIKIFTIKARHGPSGQTKELRVDPARYLISSTNDIMATLDNTGLDIDASLNQPVEEIKSETQGIIFVNILSDDLMDLG